MVQRRDWKDADDARAAVADYIHTFFNTERRHSTLGQMSPAAFETRWAGQQAFAQEAAA